MRVAMYEGDCLGIMRGFKRASVDLVLCSPPYERKRTYGIGYNLAADEWVAWSADRFQECVRVSRGAVCWVVGHGSSGKVKPWWPGPALLIAELHRRGVHLLSPLWYKRHGIPGAGGKQWFAPKVEWIVCGTSAPNGRLPYSRVTDELGHTPKHPVGGALSYRTADGQRINEHKRGYRGHANPFKQPKKSNPGDVIECGAAGGGRIGDELAHENEAPFPEKLADPIVRALCPPGGVVLDCFGGSGTTAKVAIANGRNAVLIDLRAGKGGLDTAHRRLDAWHAANPSSEFEIVRPGARSSS